MNSRPSPPGARPAKPKLHGEQHPAAEPSSLAAAQRVTPELHAQVTGALAADRPILIVLAGSNGAGKSTYYRAALSNTGLPFINADELAVAMRPADPGAVAYEAMRVAESAP